MTSVSTAEHTRRDLLYIIPLPHEGEFDCWFCPSHGSRYDTAGRIRKGPVPQNLHLPPFAFISDTRIRIG